MSSYFEPPKDGPSSKWYEQHNMVSRPPKPKPGLDVMPSDYVQDFTKRPEPFPEIAKRLMPNLGAFTAIVKGRFGGVKQHYQLGLWPLEGLEIVYLTPPLPTEADCWAYLESLRTRLSGGDIGIKLSQIPTHANQRWWIWLAPVRWLDRLRFWTLDDNKIRLGKAAKAFRRLRVAHK